MTERWRDRTMFTVLALATCAAYANSFHGVFLFDDFRSITDNPHIHSAWPPWEGLFGGFNRTRPLVQYSLAINYALSGSNVGGYHAVNLLIHLFAALTLFGLLRRLFARPALRELNGTHGTWIAFICALLWALHPLNTEAVTYIIQRSEEAVGLFLFLTLHCLERATPMRDEQRMSTAWSVAAVVSCAAGFLCKQSMCVVPVLALLYDRTFLARSFATAWRRRWPLHLCLFATSGLLIVTTFTVPAPIGAGFQFSRVTPLNYALSQFGVILHYLRLTLWPDALCLDYWWPVAAKAQDIWPGALVLVILFAFTLLNVWRNSALGFAGAFFFLTLAPSSSIMPLDDLAFEHRMYAPLAAVIAAVVVLTYRMLNAESQRRTAVAMALSIAAALGVRTFLRNADYRSTVALWSTVVAQRPENPRGHNNLGLGFYENGQIAPAETEFREALRLAPDYWQASYNLGLAMETRGFVYEALEHYKDALAHNAGYAEAQWRFANILNNRGLAMREAGLLDGAASEFRNAKAACPTFWQAHYNLGLVFEATGHPQLAMACYQEVARLNPTFVDAQKRLLSTQASLSINKPNH